MRTIKQIGFSILVLISLYGVSGGMDYYYESDMKSIAFNVADNLQLNMLYPLDKVVPIMCTSLVEMDDFQSSSAFGRLMGEQIASRFSQHGYKIIELRMSKNTLMMHQNNVLALTEDIRELSTSHNAQAVIVGMYTIVRDEVYISTRLINAADHSLVSSCETTVPFSQTLRELISDRKSGLGGGGGGGGSGAISEGSIYLKPSVPSSARIIQNRLARKGCYSGKIDGVWGPLSRAGLKKFKSDHGLPADEQWNLKVQKELFRGSGQ